MFVDFGDETNDAARDETHIYLQQHLRCVPQFLFFCTEEERMRKNIYLYKYRCLSTTSNLWFHWFSHTISLIPYSHKKSLENLFVCLLKEINDFRKSNRGRNVINQAERKKKKLHLVPFKFFFQFSTFPFGMWKSNCLKKTRFIFLWLGLQRREVGVSGSTQRTSLGDGDVTQSLSLSFSIYHSDIN